MSYSKINFNKKGKRYAVFVYSIRQEKSDFDRMIFVLPVAKCIEAQKASGLERKKVLSKNWARRMKNFRLSDGVMLFERKYEAYEYAIQLKKSISESYHVRIRYDDQRNYRVYCHQLESTVINDRSFLKHNPSLQQSNSISTECYYVGQTQFDVWVRLKNHMDKTRQDSSKWGKKFFIGRDEKREFIKAHEKSMSLVHKFSQETNTPINGLLYSESIVIEASLAKWLKEQGFFSYFA